MLKICNNVRYIIISIICSFLFAFIIGGVVNAEESSRTITLHTDYSKFGVIDGNDVKDITYQLDVFGSWSLKTPRDDSGSYHDYTMGKFDYIYDRIVNDKIITGWKIRGGDGTEYGDIYDVFKLDISEDIIVDAVWTKAYKVTLSTSVSGYADTEKGAKIQEVTWTFPENFDYMIGKDYSLDGEGVLEVKIPEGDMIKDASSYYNLRLEMEWGERVFDHYYFQGYRIEGVNGDLYQQWDSITVDKDINLVAVWDEGVIVTFDAGEEGYYGYSDTGIKITQRKGFYAKNSWFGFDDDDWIYDNHSYDFDYVMPSDDYNYRMLQRYDVPVRYDGYVCEQFKIKDSKDDKVYDKYATIKLGEEDITVIPVWTKGALITFDANGGKFKEYNSQWGETESKRFFSHGLYEEYERTGTDAKYNQDAFIEIPSFCNFTNVEKEGYMLTGWKIKGDESDKLYSYGTEGVYVDGDITFEAVWGDIATFTFDLDGGKVSVYDDEYNEIVLDSYSIKVPKGATSIVENDYNDPIKDGAVFAGWKIVSPVIDDEIYENGDFGYQVFYDITDTVFKAQWIEPCTVTFDANGGYWYKGDSDYWADYGYEKESTRQITVGKGAGFYANAEIEEPQNDEEDVQFYGWSMNPKMKINDESEVQWYYEPTDDLTLYAIWGKENEDKPDPTESPTITPTVEPSTVPSSGPTQNPSEKPTVTPASVPSQNPVQQPTPLFAGISTSPTCCSK